MNNRTLYILAAIALVCIGALFVVNMMPLLRSVSVEKRIALGDVRGMELVREGTPWTLNYDQQNRVAEMLNMAIAVNDKIDVENKDKDFDEIIIYRFNASPLHLKLVGERIQDTKQKLFGQNSPDLIFSIPEWNKTGYIQDVSQGELKNLLNKLYDH